MIGAVVLAAGAGRRFRAAGGGTKLLWPVDGRPLLEAPLAAVARAAVDDRVVVLGAAADDVLAAVDLHGVRAVVNEAWEDGMASSLRAGLAALDHRCAAAVVVLGDGPRLAGEAITRVAGALRDGRGPVVAAVYGDRRRHPVGLARAVWPRLPVQGEAGARVLGEPDALVDCGDLPEPGDADTPDALSL